MALALTCICQKRLGVPSMDKPFFMSRKIRNSISQGIELLRFGAFTEVDVKLLLVDLREVGRHMATSLKSEENPFTILIAEFLDVCDFVAHANRDRGVVEATVRVQAQKMRKNLNSNPSLTVDEFSGVLVNGALNANRLVMALASIAALALDKLDPASSKALVIELQERQSEIALCILSLLQDSFITLNKNEGYGLLQLKPHEGMYRLYCQVIDSKIDEEARTRTNGSGRIILGFPVIVSAAECIDPDILSCDCEVFPAPIFETFRDAKSQLKLRVLEV